jgi:glycosyltransferase involved in cell wall biosynthesis
VITSSLSIIIPTLGRPSLKGALESVVPQLGTADQVIVVGDGSQPLAKQISASYEKAIYLETVPTRCWGHEQRNLGMSAAKGGHLAFLDDDDIWLPRARIAIDRGIMGNPEKLLFFRMQHRNRTIWKTRDLAFANISTQMYVFPNAPEKLARWRPRPEGENGMGGDFLFGVETAALWPEGSAVFLTDVIARLFEHSEGRVSS